MKSRLMMAAILAVGFGWGVALMAQDQAAPAAGAVKTVSEDIADWCNVTVPEKAKIGDAIEVKVVVKNITAATKLSCHLHALAGDDKWIGFYVWSAPQDITADGTYTFKFTLKDKEGIVFARPTVFQSPDGDFKNKTKDAAGAKFTVTKN